MISKSEARGCWPGSTTYPMYPEPNYPQPYPNYPQPSTTTWTFTKEVPLKVELVAEDLETLSRALGYVDDMLGEPGVVDVEIRVKINDATSWAVLGYGESGDPCVLRFEKD